ncbi:MAG: hypothetical protein CVU05_00585 [Bacteroidetes bacterium HGW-Bacteroidetes-21]|nr:MAG: hypothetical protein CVU05_00585 [Bacteroidetes bacterium HGW-Bacteroidetes-21]
MKLLLLFSFLSILTFQQTGTFKTEQKKHAKVKQAYTDKEKTVQDTLKKYNIDISKMNIFFRVFKKEEIFELWAKNKEDATFKHIRTFPICASSGSLGPKRKEGDYQVPEGFYTINCFNPYSNYYLSLGVSYPNESDRKLGFKGKLGGSIFIHGSCCTIGCIPITDALIKELYIYAVEAKNNGQTNIPVHIFPFRMDVDDWTVIEKKIPEYKDIIDFWKNIQPGYTYFEKNKKLPKVTVASDGKYVIAS